MRRNPGRRIGEGKIEQSVGAMLRQPFLTAPLRFALLGFLPNTRLLIKTPALQLSKKTFAGQLFLGDFQRLSTLLLKTFISMA
jgi:hypothetical protein